MSRSGVPGELKGVFSEGRQLGTIESNTEVGIYGKLEKHAMQRMKGKMYPVGVRANIKEGPAVILSNIDGKNRGIRYSHSEGVQTESQWF